MFRAMDKWIDIATAPRDGSRVLLFCPTKHEPDCVRSGWWSANFQGWFEDGGLTQRLTGPDGEEPAFWMPQPAPPVVDTKARPQPVEA
jgi:hypothetical protein